MAGVESFAGWDAARDDDQRVLPQRVEYLAFDSRRACGGGFEAGSWRGSAAMVVLPRTHWMEAGACIGSGAGFSAKGRCPGGPCA